MTATNAEPTIHICGDGPHKEIVRWQDGARYCFKCRKQRDFEYVVMAPVGDSWYGPISRVECSVCKTVDGDCFPGTYRES